MHDRPVVWSTWPYQQNGRGAATQLVSRALRGAAWRVGRALPATACPQDAGMLFQRPSSGLRRRAGAVAG
eukprot:350077-Chlamydomonas_euryale.AAC.17